MARFLCSAAVAAGLFAGAASAETCGGTYKVQPGDSLSYIADKLYKDAGKWTIIHTNNLSSIGKNPNAIRAGQKLELGCINGLPTGLPGGAIVSASSEPVTATTSEVTRTQTDLLGSPQLPRIKLVTGDDFAPFTDRSLMNNGLLAEVVTAAMTQAVGDDGFDTFWVNDWAAHTDTLMPAGLMEMTYPWAKPDCEAMPDTMRCASFHYSEPMFEYLILLFVDKARPIPFSTDADIEGRTICRPEGYSMHMLDQEGRNWVAEDKINLVSPVAVSKCFEMLANGEVEGVVLNEFTARDTIHALGLTDQIEPVQSRPVAIAGLHVMVHKTHPRAEDLLAVINDGLGSIKSNGQYQEIVNRHMESIWAKF